MSDKILGWALKVHQAVYVATHGWVGHRMIMVPTLLLRTVGRKTGKVRTSALVYARDEGRYIVVGSNGGAGASPGWFFNAKDNPEVEIQIGRRHVKAKAEIVESGDAAYDRLWDLVNRKNHNRYNAYQAKTSRRIPLMALTPT